MSLRFELHVPELGLGDVPILLSVWLVPLHSKIREGERLAEIASPNVTIDLPSPASGVVTAQMVSEGQEVSVGQLLGVVEAEEISNEFG